MAKLTARQEAFVREYLVDGNASAAMRRLGCPPKSAKQAGWWQMRNPNVREAVDEGRKRLAEEAERRALDVLRDIQDVAREAREGGDLRTCLRGLELEGRHYGMFTDRVRQEISGPGGGPVPAEIVVSFVEPGAAEVAGAGDEAADADGDGASDGEDVGTVAGDGAGDGAGEEAGEGAWAVAGEGVGLCANAGECEREGERGCGAAESRADGAGRGGCTGRGGCAGRKVGAGSVCEVAFVDGFGNCGAAESARRGESTGDAVGAVAGESAANANTSFFQGSQGTHYHSFGTDSHSNGMISSSKGMISSSDRMIFSSPRTGGQ